jgi:hypothetical protein
MKPAWKVAGGAFLLLFTIVAVIGGVLGAMHHGHPGQAGHEVAQVAAPIVLLVPLVAYIVQKTRIDSKNRKDKGPG